MRSNPALIGPRDGTLRHELCPQIAVNPLRFLILLTLLATGVSSRGAESDIANPNPNQFIAMDTANWRCGAFFGH